MPRQRTPKRRSAPAKGLQQYRPKVESTKGKKAYSRKRTGWEGRRQGEYLDAPC